jgi:hypothetical protein
VIKEMNELKGAAVSMMDGRMDDALPITPILFFFPTNKKKKQPSRRVWRSAAIH